jgi:hypothetical protein
MKHTSIRTLIGASILLTLAFAVAAQAQEPLRLRAYAVQTGQVPGDRASVVDLTITRWSTDDERQDLIKIFRMNGSDALFDALQDADSVGSLRTPDSAAWDLHYAIQIPLEGGGRRIILATDRPIGFWEVYENSRSVSYHFTLIEIRLDDDGRGEGRMSVATRVELSPDGKQIQLEDYSAQPVLLRNVRRVAD